MLAFGSHEPAVSAFEFFLIFLGVPAALWGLSVGACVVSGKWRSLTFSSAVLVGGIGLIWGIGALTASAGLGILFGAGLLLVGALIGFVALFLRPGLWSQPRSEDSVDSNGPEDQEDRVGW